MANTDLCTLAEACDLLHVSLSTIRRLIDRGELPVIRIGRRVLVRRNDLLAVIERHE